MKSVDYSMISNARKLIKEISAESCIIYNKHCSHSCESVALGVLESQLRIASKLAELQNQISDD